MGFGKFITVTITVQVSRRCETNKQVVSLKQGLQTSIRPWPRLAGVTPRNPLLVTRMNRRHRIDLGLGPPQPKREWLTRPHRGHSANSGRHSVPTRRRLVAEAKRYPRRGHAGRTYRESHLELAIRRTPPPLRLEDYETHKGPWRPGYSGVLVREYRDRISDWIS